MCRKIFQVPVGKILACCGNEAMPDGTILAAVKQEPEEITEAELEAGGDYDKKTDQKRINAFMDQPSVCSLKKHKQRKHDLIFPRPLRQRSKRRRRWPA